MKTFYTLPGQHASHKICSYTLIDAAAYTFMTDPVLIWRDLDQLELGASKWIWRKEQ